jgi:hypothetical protein
MATGGGWEAAGRHGRYPHTNPRALASIYFRLCTDLRLHPSYLARGSVVDYGALAMHIRLL